MSKKELAEGILVSSQTITDWTKEDPLGVTPENAVKLSKFANDSLLAKSIAHNFLGLPPNMQGGKFEQHIASLKTLRIAEEKVRNEMYDANATRLLCQEEKLTESQWEELAGLAEKEALVCIINEQYLFTLCDHLGISVMDLVERSKDKWTKGGYISGKE